MQKKTKIILIITIILLLLIASVIFVLLNQKIIKIPVDKEPIEKKVEESKLPEEKKMLNKVSAPIKSSPELEVKRLASFFAERYGSYSNQAPFQNLIELEPFMTERMQLSSQELQEKRFSEIGKDIPLAPPLTDSGQALDKRKNTPLTPLNRGEYHGFTTKALSTKILELQNNKAKVLVQTQRQEAFGTTDNVRVFYQDIEIEMIKVGEEWKVDRVKWLNG